MKRADDLRVFIYARISDKDPEEDKVAGQVADCLKRFGPEYGTAHITEFTDDGISATSGVDRPGWLAMLEAIERGECDVVVATEEERFSRGSRTDKADLFAACMDTGTFWHTIRDGLTDPSKDDDAEFLSDLRDSLGRREVRRKTSRQRDRFDKQTALGKPLWGTRPFGFEKDRITLRESEAAELRWAYSEILNGSSLYEIIQTWNHLGVLTSTGKQWSYATVQQMLKRPRNAGIVMRNDEEQVGVIAQWEPIVTRGEWEATVAILTNPKRRTQPGRKQKHLSSSLIRCGVCGAVMRSASVKQKGVPTPIYKCSSKMVGSNLKTRHPAIQTSIIDPLVREAIVTAFLLGPANLIPNEVQASRGPLEVSLSRVRASRARVINLVVQDLIEEGDAATELAGLKAKEAALEDQLAGLARSSAQAAMTVDLRENLFAGSTVSMDDAVAVKQALRERFDALDIARQRELVRSLLDIEVGLGRGPGRVSITHKVVIGLNEPDIDLTRHARPVSEVSA
jgi:site-specific DNA recombinase